MNSHRPTTIPIRTTVALALLALAVPLPLAAQNAEPLPATEIEEYLGTWTLSASFQNNPVELTLEIVDQEGSARAALGSAFQPEPQLVDKITRSDEGIELAYDADFGGATVRIHLRAALSDGKLSGSFGDDGGFFTADFTGERAAAPAGIVADAIAASSDPNRERRRRRTFGGSEVAELELGESKIRVLFTPLEIESNDHQSLLATGPGNVFTYQGGRCVKLLTDLDLAFGETLVKSHNFAPEYPGAYSLWLRRADDGWRLVFNNEPDIWGTQHDPEGDVAEVPLRVSELAEPQVEMRVELEAADGGGVLRIAWGDTAWSAPFRAE